MDQARRPRRSSAERSEARWAAQRPPPKPFPAHGAPHPWEEYTLVRRLGRGSFGQVYEAVHVPSAQLVAIKQVHLEATSKDGGTQATQTQDLSEIQREVTSLAQCATCERVTKYYGSFLKRYTLWVVMELMDAGSCLGLLRRVGPLDEPVIAVICRELVLGLEYLHGQGIIHRDIKAANVLLARSGQVKLADFGVAAQLVHRGSRRNTLVGTPYWMAPEVIKQSHYDARADIWSLGITALELATGHPPLSSYHPMRALFLIPKANPPSVDTSDGKHTAPFARFVELCLAKRPEERASAHSLRTTSFLEDAGSLDLVARLLDGGTPPEPAPEPGLDGQDTSVLDTSSFSEWAFDASTEPGAQASALGVDVSRVEAVPGAASALVDALRTDERLAPPAEISERAAPSAPTTPAIAATPASPHPVTPKTPKTPPEVPESPRRTPRPSSQLSSPTPRPRPDAAHVVVQNALEQLAYQAGQDAAQADTPTTQLYQLHGLLSQMGRQNPEYLEQFVDLLRTPQRGAARAPAAHSRLAGLLYERWLEGLRARWHVLDTGHGPT